VKLRDNWQAAAFCAALIICVVLLLVSSQSGWCEADERSVVCARNWFNAAGNVAGSLIALIAAGFALAQARAATRQVELSLIPRISERIRRLHLLNTVIRGMSYECRSARATAVEIGKRTSENPPSGALIRAWSRLAFRHSQLEKRIVGLREAEANAPDDLAAATWCQQASSVVEQMIIISGSIFDLNPVKSGEDVAIVQESDAEIYHQILRDDPSILTDLTDAAAAAITKLDSIQREAEMLRTNLEMRLHEIEVRYGVQPFSPRQL